MGDHRARRPRVGQVWYDPWRDELLVVDEILRDFGIFLKHPDPRSVRCILDSSRWRNWPEGLVYVGDAT